MKAKDREAIYRELAGQLIVLCGDSIEVLDKLSRARWCQIDASQWSKILSRRLHRLTKGLDFSQIPDMQKKGKSK